MPGTPSTAWPPIFTGLAFLSAAIYSLTIPRRSLIYARLLLAVPATIAFWYAGFGPHEFRQRQFRCEPSTIGLYGIMRVIETCIVSIWDETPPRWVVHGKIMPLPTTVLQRLAYSLDLLTSLRGTRCVEIYITRSQTALLISFLPSWFKDTHWDFAPSPIVRFAQTPLSRTSALWQRLKSFLVLYILADVFDSIARYKEWDTTLMYPVTSSGLPIHLQAIYSLSVCMLNYIGMGLSHDILAIISISLGANPSAWPPMFNYPLASKSLADFWTKRWHLVFRHVFSRLAHLPWVVSSKYFSRSTARALRVLTIFLLTTLLHFLILSTMPVDDLHPHSTFFDRSTIRFFLLQPVGLAIEALAVTPLSNIFSPPIRDAIRRAWVWVFLVWSGRFWCDVWIRRGLWDQTENGLPYSIVRGILWGRWALR